MKQCKVCGELKALTEFYRMAQMRDGHRNDCKACNLAAKAARYQANPGPARARAQQWRIDNPERYASNQADFRASGRKAIADRKSHLKRNYGLTIEQYEAMLLAQGGGCGICRRTPRPDISLHVDHDHASGAIRGILCFKCNNALGDFEDDPVLLRRALAYVERQGADDLDELARRRVWALVGRKAG
ncbi:MAG: endonuclease VII domain-containing protein [Acidimicrobiia bacterium]